MPLRNQPYIPLYVQDFSTDEKLRECKAETIGVYIFIMCLLHKQENYGVFLLKQKDKQTVKPLKNFAYKLVKHLPFTFEVIENALQELTDEKIILFDDDKFWQKRMVKDNDISEKRSISGSEGGKKTQFAKANIKAKGEANSEYEYENEINNKEGVLKTEFENQFSALTALSSLTGFSIEEIKKTIPDFIQVLISQNQIDDPFKQQWKYFTNWFKAKCKPGTNGSQPEIKKQPVRRDKDKYDLMFDARYKAAREEAAGIIITKE